MHWALDPSACAASGPFVSAARYDAQTIGLLALAFFSTLCHGFVIHYHAVNPPHPKFALRPARRWWMRIHIVSGTLEILASIAAWFVPACTAAGRVQAGLAFVHVASAASMTGTVFGVQLVMIPAYTFICLVKGALALMLAASPCCWETSIQLYLVHSVYAWVRVFGYVSWRYHLFRGSEYSVSILLAGFLGGAAVNPAVPVACVLFIAAWAAVARAVLTPEEFAYQTWENSGQMYDAFVSKHDHHGGRGRGGRLLGVDPEPRIRKAFRAADVDRSGFLTLEEAENMARNEEAGPLLDVIRIHAAHLSPAEAARMQLSEADVMALVQGAGNVLRAHIPEGASDRDKARCIFDAIDTSNDGAITVEELAVVARGFGLPMSEVQHTLRLLDSDKDGRLSFDEFFEKFEPLWRYALSDIQAAKRYEYMHRTTAQKRGHALTAVTVSGPSSDSSYGGAGRPQGLPADEEGAEPTHAPHPASTWGRRIQGAFQLRAGPKRGRKGAPGKGAPGKPPPPTML